MDNVYIFNYFIYILYRIPNFVKGRKKKQKERDAVRARSAPGQVGLLCTHTVYNCTQCTANTPAFQICSTSNMGLLMHELDLFRTRVVLVATPPCPPTLSGGTPDYTRITPQVGPVYSLVLTTPRVSRYS